MKALGTYKNGNYKVTIFDDGTKVRFNNLNELIPEKPESIDLKITNRCDMNCPMCHENSLEDGEHADLSKLSFIETMLPYTEIAIGGGNPLSHPNLETFLIVLKTYKLIANMTVHQAHFLKEQENYKKSENNIPNFISDAKQTDVNMIRR